MSFRLSLRRVDFALALVLLAGPARAATLTGSDYAGADLIPSNGDVLSGTFTNVKLFRVDSGVTVFVAPGVPLVIYASTAHVRGTIEGTGRGELGGSGGNVNTAGQDGFGTGKGSAGGAPTPGRGGGGAGFSGWGGRGGGSAQASSGTFYGATNTAPASSDDALMGSGGGGGGGGGDSSGGVGGSGGAAIYIEASSITVSGSMLVSGSTAATVAGSANGAVALPGSGGGGSGGTLLLRATLALSLESGTLEARGGGGGHIADALDCRTSAPGGGGSGGRIKIYRRAGAQFVVTLSTQAGPAGTRFCGTASGSAPESGSLGSITTGTIAAAPTNFALSQAHITSITWTWTATADFADGANPGYRIYAGSQTAPFPGAQATAGSGATSVDETGLSPDTTYYRAIAAYTDWGPSSLSNATTAWTRASIPTAPAYSAAAATSLSFAWSAGSPANPSHTLYEVELSTVPALANTVRAGFIVATSSTPANLAANTTHYMRVRAVNIAGLQTAYSAIVATATSANAPASASFASVYVSSVLFQWSANGNPSQTWFEAQASSDAFVTIASSRTLNTSATFAALVTGTVYSYRVRALNHNEVQSAFTTAISTASGLLSDTSPPTAPGRPTPDKLFSYDGSVTFSWTPASSSVGILKYKFFLGTTPGGDDVLSNVDVFATQRAVTGLATGRSYYAMVLPVSNAGTNGFSSDPSQGVAVYIPSQAGTIAKAYNWPNPFDPRAGATQIGVQLKEAADVTLTVYDLRGREVVSRTRGLAAGNQVMEWDGRSAAGARVAPGGYVIVLRKRYASGEESERLKVAVVY